MSESVPQSHGELVVKAVDQSHSLVGGATVTVSDMDGNPIATTSTDQYGNTNALKLAAPQKDFALEHLEEKPYGQYIVTVQHPGYTPVKMVGVQIYDGAKAVPSIELAAVDRSKRDEGAFQEIIIKDHALYLETEAATVTPLNLHTIPGPSPEYSPLMIPVSPPWNYESFGEESSSPTGAQYELIIPEKIRVHLGSSDDVNAPNKDIPFVEYIKGVVCTEILGFLEEEAVKANVVAAVSFTLNRIYTNFWRMQGKDYDITDSTNPDHDYTANYTPQENLVRVVDEYFNEYIASPNPQPFLSSYCDGVKKKCASKGGMEQIPSQLLAKQQWSYRRILEHFYGKDKGIVQARAVVIGGRIVPIIRDLKQGDENSNVLLMQQYLKIMGDKWNVLVYKKAEEEQGKFGKKTFEAVKSFQKLSMHLPLNKQTGIIDQKTWYELNRQYMIVKPVRMRAPQYLYPYQNSYPSPFRYPASYYGPSTIVHRPDCPHNLRLRQLQTNGYPIPSSITPQLSSLINGTVWGTANRNERNYRPLFPPPTVVPSNGYKYRDLLDFYNYFG